MDLAHEETKFWWAWTTLPIKCCTKQSKLPAKTAQIWFYNTEKGSQLLRFPPKMGIEAIPKNGNRSKSTLGLHCSAKESKLQLVLSLLSRYPLCSCISQEVSQGWWKKRGILEQSHQEGALSPVARANQAIYRTVFQITWKLPRPPGVFYWLTRNLLHNTLIGPHSLQRQ